MTHGAADMAVSAENMRAHMRTSMFVVAQCEGPGGADAVKIRNMSHSGALIEAKTLPRVGQSLLLRRADLEVRGRIVWASDGQAGVRFDVDVVVGDWMPSRARSQADVDKDFGRLKAESRPPDPAGGNACVNTKHTPVGVKPTRVPTADDLVALAASLEKLGRNLSRDSRVITQHLVELQALDLASQTLRALARPHSA